MHFAAPAVPDVLALQKQFLNVLEMASRGKRPWELVQTFVQLMDNAPAGRLAAIAARMKSFQESEPLTQDELKSWLEIVKDSSGMTLHDALGIGLNPAISITSRSYEEGPWGFRVPLDEIVFPQELLGEAETGLLSGALDGVVLLATPRELPRTLPEGIPIPQTLAGKSPERWIAEDMTVLQYYILHFVARGGVVNHLDHALSLWGSMRFVENVSLKTGLLTVGWAPGTHPTLDQMQALYHGLPPQRLLAHTLGERPRLHFAATDPSPSTGRCLQYGDIRTEGKRQFRACAPLDLRTQDHVTWRWLVANQVNFMNPLQYAALALFLQVHDPRNIRSYPVRSGGSKTSNLLLSGFTLDGKQVRGAHAYSSENGMSFSFHDDGSAPTNVSVYSSIG